LGDAFSQDASCVGASAAGIEQLFGLLAARPDIDRLDKLSVVLGHDFARLVEADGDCAGKTGGDVVVVPLGPILAALRDEVFS